MDAAAVERAQQAEAGPGQADVLGGGRDEQAPGHDVTSWLAGWGRGRPGGDEAGGVAGDHQLLVGRHHERLDRTGTADPPPGGPAVPGVGLGVLGQAEEPQATQDQAADDRAVLPDAAGEDQRVEPFQVDDQPGDRLGQPVHEDVEGEPGPLVSARGRGLDGPHVVADTGQPQQAALRVQHLGKLRGGLPGLAGQVAEDTGIDITGAGAHDQPLHRGQSHRGVHRHAVPDRRGAAAVAEMGGDQAQFGRAAF